MRRLWGGFGAVLWLACSAGPPPAANAPAASAVGGENSEPGSVSADPSPAPGRFDSAAPGRFDARLSLYPYPFPVHFHRVQAQGQVLEMAYMDLSPASSPRGTVLLLHGKNFSGAYWQRTAADLLAEGYRVVIPDQIGFGKSDKPTGFQFSFAALALHTHGLLAELGVTSATVVGHSMGGMLATRYALMFPEHTAGLVLVNPIGLEDWSHVVPYAPIAALYEQELKGTPESVRQYMRNSYFDGQWKPEYDALAELQMEWTRSPDRQRLAWVSALTYDMIFTQPVVHEFPRVGVKTLLIIGTRDRTALGKDRVSPEVRQTLGLYGELGRRARDAIVGAQLVELSGVGHIPQFEAYDAYWGALRAFLAE